MSGVYYALIIELRVCFSTTQVNPIDILTINETLLDPTKSNNELHISGLEVIRRDEAGGQFDNDGESGGGLLLVQGNIA